ncbi:hypothetical protein GCM10027160_26810 [Streptomyces calidiresistens]
MPRGMTREFRRTLPAPLPKGFREGINPALPDTGYGSDGS